MAASNYCAVNNNLTCLKKLLVTGKVDISQHRLLHKVKANKTRQLIEDYFKSPAEYLARWSKELDPDRGPAADLFVLQSCWLKPGCQPVCQSDCQQKSTGKRLPVAGDKPTTNNLSSNNPTADNPTADNHDNETKIVRFFSILDRVKNDPAQIICLKTCDTTGQYTYIPNSYLRVAQADLANDDH